MAASSSLKNSALYASVDGTMCIFCRNACFIAFRLNTYFANINKSGLLLFYLGFCQKIINTSTPSQYMNLIPVYRAHMQSARRWRESRHRPGSRLPLLSGCFCQACGYLRSFHQMALPVNGSTHLIPAYFSFINPERMKGWDGLVGWSVADGLPTHRPAAGRAQDRESSPVTFRDRRSTTVPRHQLRR